MSNAPVEPDCICGHPSDEHNYTPSGCGVTFCYHGSTGDSPVGTCGCREYLPNDEGDH